MGVACGYVTVTGTSVDVSKHLPTHDKQHGDVGKYFYVGAPYLCEVCLRKKGRSFIVADICVVATNGVTFDMELSTVGL